MYNEQRTQAEQDRITDLAQELRYKRNRESAAKEKAAARAKAEAAARVNAAYEAEAQLAREIGASLDNRYGSGLVKIEPIDVERTEEGHRTFDTGELPKEARQQAWAMLRQGVIEGLVAATFGISIQALRRELVAGRPTLALAYWDMHLDAIRLNTSAHSEMVAEEYGEGNGTH